MRKISSSSPSSSSLISSRKEQKPCSSSNTSSGGSKTTPCCSKVGIKRGPWTAEEDEVLVRFISKEGEGKWRTLPKRAGLARCGKSCRLRWMNYLRPSVKRGHIAPDEEDLILRLHRLLGNRWSLIAGRIPGRTDNEIKNYWNTHLSKKLISQGIDPRTHKPFNNPVDQHTNKASSSSSSKNNLHRLPSNPSPNNQTPFSTVPEEEAPSEAAGIQTNRDNGYFDFGKYNQSKGKVDNFHGNIDNFSVNISNGSGIGVRSTNTNHGMGNEEDDEDINYGSDDVFSSFLNSLINEDAYADPQHQILPNGINTPFSTGPQDPCLSETILSNGWESAAMMSSALNQNGPSRADDRVE